MMAFAAGFSMGRLPRPWQDSQLETDAPVSKRLCGHAPISEIGNSVPHDRPRRLPRRCEPGIFVIAAENQPSPQTIAGRAKRRTPCPI